MSSKLLVCEDDKSMGRLIQVSLERLGANVVLARDGEDAIEHLEREQFDRVALDVVMPKKDGYDVLSWIRTQKETKDLWVAFMTLDAEEWQRRTDLPYRADVYLSKPFDPHLLLP